MDDLLWRHLRDLPAFRALLRAVEASFYASLPLPRPVLDLGCGDAHFAALAFDEPLEMGFDSWWKPLTEARGRRAHQRLSQAQGARMPFPGGYFATVVGNSVLEHVPRVQPVLDEVARVLRPGGWFYFCVPGPGFLPSLSIGRALDEVGLPAMGDAYRELFNCVSRHHHCDGACVWERRLGMAGLRVIRWWSYFPPRSMAAFEWGHYLGIPSFVCRRLVGRWVLWPSRANLWLTERLLRPLYEESLSSHHFSESAILMARNGSSESGDDEAGAYLFFVAQRVVQMVDLSPVGGAGGLV